MCEHSDFSLPEIFMDSDFYRQWKSRDTTSGFSYNVFY